MDKSNMSELRFEAPLATFDMDEWNEFVDDQPASPCSAVSKMSEASSSVSSSPQNNKNNNSYVTELDIGDNNSEDFENENLSGSLEDLVNTFDAKIIKCFKNYNEHSEIIAPIQIRSEDDILADNQTWWTLTGHYGNIYPIDWTKSGMVGGGGDTKLFGGGIGEDESYSQACIDSGVVDDHRSDDNNTADGWKGQDDDVDDDAEDDDAMLLDDHVISADDVINELDELLDDANNSNTQRSLRSLHGKLHSRKNFVSRILATDHLRLTKKFLNNSIKDREANIADNPELLKLPLETLLRMRDDMNRSILDHSEVLIRELDIRDELEYEKELKNQFIWLLITVQKRRKELMSSLQLQQQQQQQQQQPQQLSHNHNTNNNNNNNNNCIVVDNNSTTNFNVNYNNNNNNNSNSHQLIDDNNNNKSNVNNINNNNTVTSTPANNNNSNNNNTTKLINTSNTTTTNTTTGVKQPAYLTTVIPYKKQQAPLSIDILLVFIRILSAINDNSPTTPSLLTDYILKILCPAA